MLSVQENERLTHVGPGTPTGELFRRYWHPIAPKLELDENPTKEIRILSEDLVLYKDRSGQYGLIERFCAHRRVNLAYGIPEENGLRCMYHGWMYDETGQCVEQPFEETVRPEARFKDKIKLKGYPVQEFGGLLWAYMGPLPAPELPKWEPMMWEYAARDIAIARLPCNWLQCQENSLDPIHLEWLHARYGEYERWRRGQQDNQWAIPSSKVMKHLKIGFDIFDHGIVKRRVLEGRTEESDDWKIGHPILFPNILFVGDEMMGALQFRVPVDEHNTYHVSYFTWKAAPGFQTPKQTRVPYRYTPLFEPNGRFVIDYTFNQDYMVWMSQGALSDRNLEKLGDSDKGIIMYRKLLREQIDIVDDGGDPMNVFRDPAQAEYIELPLEQVKFSDGTLFAEYQPPEAGETDAEDEIRHVLNTWNLYQEQEATAGVR